MAGSSSQAVADTLAVHGLPADRARALATDLEAWRHMYPAEVTWQMCTQRWLAPSIPFPVHQWLYDYVFQDWDERRGPRPAWTPTAEELASTNVASLMRLLGVATYAELYQRSISDRQGFWRRAIERLGLRFRMPYESVLDTAGGPEHPRWLRGALYNIVDSCFLAPDNAPAIISAGPDGERTTVSYGELAAQVARVASGLRAAGFVPGNAIAIDMPMTATAVAVYLGIVAAGMVVVSIADSLAAEEVATRLRIARASGLFTAYEVVRGGKRLSLYHKILTAQPPRTIVVDAGTATLRTGDLTFESLLAAAPPDVLDPLPGDADTITNVLFSSGTTGEPKAIPWTQLQPIKCAVDAALHLDVRAGDVVAWPTNLGWMMGPWLIYASLLNQGTIALYTDAPTTRAFGEFVSRARVNVLGLVPSMVKSWRSHDGTAESLRGLDFSAIRCFGSTGEASNATDYLYLMMLAGYRPVIEYCGGTEIGGGYLTGTLALPASPATFSTPALGSELVLYDESGNPTDNGEVFLVPPTLGYSLTLLNRDHHQVYYAGTPPGPGGQLLRRHGDQLERLGGGYYRALGRVDDTMNLGGIKVSSAEIERVLDGVPGVARTAAIAISPPGGGPSELVVYVIPADLAEDLALLTARLQQGLKQRLNPLFRIFDVVVVDSLPVTASNKIMRRELRAHYRPRPTL